MNDLTAKIVLIFAMLVAGAMVGRTEPSTVDESKVVDPTGILRMPIPEKLLVLTFDDGPASGYTVVAPILKSMGFGGSFYVTDFDSFQTRKDWYLTWRQMKSLADDGFEIGNHTKGHAGGAGIGPFLDLEDDLLANNVPKPTTVCWPVYQVNPRTYPDLAANGYLFGRGGHERPYRPTVDNPFDVPSFSISDRISVETFITYVQQACQGRVVVLTFHGVPDREHPSVGLDPATFKVMMQYLKENDYKAISLRDLSKYVDPAKAAKLPTTANNIKDTGSVRSIQSDKPYFGNDIRSFNFPGQSSVDISGNRINVTVPHTTNVTALAPTLKVSDEATVVPASAAVRDFTNPQNYTVTSRTGNSKTYVVTVKKTAVTAAKDILDFAIPGRASVTRSGTNINVYVPTSTDVTSLSPTFKLSPFASAVPASGTQRDFSKPQKYIVTAQDNSAQDFIVTLIKSNQPRAFTWDSDKIGNWSQAAKWSNNLADGSAPKAGGAGEYTLHFTKTGNYTATNDLGNEFLLNQIHFSCANAKVDGNSLSFVKNPRSLTLPAINQSAGGEVSIEAGVKLVDHATVDITRNAKVILPGVISGKGGITKTGDGQLRITHKTNSYEGGTKINAGSVMVLSANAGLGSGPVWLNGDASLDLENVQATNSLILDGGTINAGNGFGDSWNAPITLHGNTKITSYADFLVNNKSGGISGPGGFTQIGSIGAFGLVNSGTVSLGGTNTYTGPTTVKLGTLRVLKAKSLYDADPGSWTPAKISIAPAAQFRISAGGQDEFTGAQIGTLLESLTKGVDNNGLMARAVFCVDTANATRPVTVSATIADSTGPGGGAFVLKKCGAGTLQLSGRNTYTGQTLLESGALIISGLNSVVKGRPSSSLGAPANVEAGEIVIGSGDGDSTLIYIGTGETSDRVMNLAGKKSAVTFDQSGTGLFKLTSTFVISGYGTSKTIILKGDSDGAGEIAGNIADPYDRANKAMMSVTKSGSGTWTLSGTNSYTGPTNVTKGILSLANKRSLADKTDVSVSNGGMLDLPFQGETNIHSLTLDGKLQPDGLYSATNCPNFIKGTGAFRIGSKK